ncbi:sugar-binding domain-containing protein [Actinomyces ruminicola]|uniref:sugar-binding domain-containing protein n=1 Tax=Actinomyces ruminicola TaxID=332524 RepID=UPI0011CA929B|nr:sugar-binding domain-containing protein [Actinomyces ruminicola]
MGEDSTRGDVELLLRVARMYYEQHLTQVEIAREVGYSRPSVSRLLARARDQGIVHITISHPLEHVLSVEKRLREALPLKAVRVAEVDGTDVIGAVGQAAAELLINSVSNGQVVAVGNGRSIQAAAQRIPQIPRVDCTIVQLLGSIPGGLPSWGRDAPTICTRIASQLGAKVARMPVPFPRRCGRSCASRR